MTDDTTDLAALGPFLSDELSVEVTETEVLHDGLNLLVGIETNAEDTYVLRRPNKLRRTGYMNDLETEYTVLERLRSTSIPTPVPVRYCANESILDRPFFVMTRLDGETVPNGARLPERFRNATSREQVTTQLVDTLAGIHSLDPEPFESVCDRRTPLDQVENALERLDAAADVTGRERPRLERVGNWLHRNAPSNPDVRLVHGDFRPSNVLLGGANTPEITGVLDWESAMVGDPCTELGYLLLHWRRDDDAMVNLDDLESTYMDETYRDIEATNERGLCPFTAEPGSLSRQELITRYEDRAGITFENGRFYRAQAAFLLAMVWEDLDRHAVEAGAEPEPAPFVDYMALVAARIVDEGDS